MSDLTSGTLKSTRRIVRFLIPAAIVVASMGCATATVKKVPSPAQYMIDGKSHWTTEMQQEADRMEGIRFYLPRPFISVFESFPVATDIYLAKGRVSPDGRYVAIDSVMPLSTREDFAGMSSKTAKSLPSDLRIPQSWIFRTGATPGQTGATGRGEARGATEGKDSSAALPEEAMNKLREAVQDSGDNAANAKKQSTAAQDAATQAAGSAGAAKASVQQQVTGQNRRAVTNDNGAFAYQPLRGNFDLVYLPDFDEQYVVSSQSGLGNAQFQLNLGQGWSLQGFNSFTDNSALTKRVFDVIDTGLELAKAAAKAAAAAAGIPLPLGEARAGLETPGPEQRMNEAQGTPVAVKIVVLHYAAKGIYPVIKPRELMSRTSASMVMNLADSTPRVMRPSDVDLEHALAEQARLERRATVPVYPYQYVSFNTFQYMTIEALTPQGLPFGTLYDKTGTTGEPGDRRATEPPPSHGPGSDIDTKVLDAALKAVESTAISATNSVIEKELSGKPANEKPKVESVSLRTASDGTNRVASGELKWSGASGSMNDDLASKIRGALDAMIAANADVTKANGATQMHLSREFPLTRLQASAGGGSGLQPALDAAEAAALKAGNDAIIHSLPTTASDQRPKIDAVDLTSAPEPKAEVRWSGPSGVMTDQVKKDVQAAIAKVVEEDANIKKQNGDQALKLLSFTFKP